MPHNRRSHRRGAALITLVRHHGRIMGLLLALPLPGLASEAAVPPTPALLAPVEAVPSHPTEAGVGLEAARTEVRERATDWVRRASDVLEPVLSAPGKLIAQGRASWYGHGFHGRRTASGDIFDMHAMTAAHRTLPFGTKLRVRSVATGKEVVVRVTDRGPYAHQRIIDLSLGAAKALGVQQRGVTEVQLIKE